MISAVQFYRRSLKKKKTIICIAFSLKDTQKLLMQSLSLYKSCLFSMLLNNNIADIEKLDGICSPISVVDKFSRLFLHPSMFSNKILRSE